MCLKYFAFLLCIAIDEIEGFGPRKLYTLSLPSNIASVRVVGRQLMIVGPYYVAKVDNIQWKYAQRSRMNIRVINKDIPDPRMIGGLPAGTLRDTKEHFFWLTSWATNETDGRVIIMRETIDYSDWRNIDVDTGWNYDHVEWVDMNLDGRKDCLTARYRGGVGQLLWFEHPHGQSDWNQNIINEGLADGNFFAFAYGAKKYILVAGNQFNALSLFWTAHPRNNWVEAKHLRYRVVDNYGKYFDVQVIDLNNDGKKDVLTTTIQISNSRGQVLGYDLPKELRRGNWHRHVLAAGFYADYSPGKAIAYWPNKWKKKDERPSIFLSGGGEGKLFILTPLLRKGWAYIKTSIPVGAGVVGIPYITDLNGDSYNEFFVPQANKLHVFADDYKSSVAQPAKQSSSGGGKRSTTTRAPVKFRPGYYRPTTRPPLPALPRNATPVVPLRPMTSIDAEEENHGRGEPSDHLFKPSSGNKNPADATDSAAKPSKPGKRPSPVATGDHRLVPKQDGVSPTEIKHTAGNHDHNPAEFTPTVQLFTSSSPFHPSHHGHYDVINTPSTHLVPVEEHVDEDILLSTNRTTTTVATTTTTEPVEPPSNLMMKVSERKYWHHEEALSACDAEKRVLCSLQQLQTAVNLEKSIIPDTVWGWFDVDARAAKLEKCVPGEVKYEGYVCYNADVVHVPVQQETQLPAFCCAIVSGALFTKEKYRSHDEASHGCDEHSNHHLCTGDEMVQVWVESTYKDMAWGWYSEPGYMIRMTKSCDVTNRLWPGYLCVDGLFEMSEIRAAAEESAYCCRHNSASSVHFHLRVTLFLLGVATTILTIFAI